MKATYEILVRVKWEGSDGPTFADFDPCPVRGLTALQSATEWVERVLGATLEPAAGRITTEVKNE